MTLSDIYNNFYSAWESIPAGEKTIINLSNRLLIKKPRVPMIVMEN